MQEIRTDVAHCGFGQPVPDIGHPGRRALIVGECLGLGFSLTIFK